MIKELFDLSGKNAVVSGGSGLYGKQIVLSLADAGAKVYIASRNIDKNEEYAKSLRDKGYRVYSKFLDMSNKESVENLVKDLEKENGKIDILINNAVSRPMNSIDEVENFTESMRVNATGNYLMCKIFGDSMAKCGGGSVVNIGSYQGILGPDDTLYKGLEFSAFEAPDYFFHKGGLTNLTRFFASYYGPQKVRFNIMELGGLNVSGDSHMNKEFVARYSERTFLKRLANETDIMGAIVYLSSPASDYVTGAVLCIDGGYSAK